MVKFGEKFKSQNQFVIACRRVLVIQIHIETNKVLW